MKTYGLKYFFVILVLLFINAGCKKDEPREPSEKRGDLISSEFISGYSSEMISSLIENINVDIDIDLEYDVDAYKIVYFTPGPDGSLIPASGALMFPKGESDLPAVSLHHGTETKRILVASEDPLSTGEGIAGLASASAGFAAFLPDMLGLGESGILHPYLIADLSAGTVIDMLTAAKTFCTRNNIDLNYDLYIGGYSEGGYVTLAVQKEIEAGKDMPYHLIASAPGAGPYDLYNTVFHFLDLDEYPEPSFMAYLFNAYNYVYRWNRIPEIYLSPYAGMMPDLFDGTKTTAQINDELPVRVSELFTADFIAGLKDGTDKQVLDALKNNTLLSWTPVTPTRFYHSDADRIVPYQNSVTAVNTFKNNGAPDIELITIDNLEHSDAAIPAYTGMIKWFDSLRRQR